MARIGIDVDDTVLDLVSIWLEKYNEEYNDNVKIYDITNWNISEFVKCVPEAFYAYLKDTDLYEEIEPIPGALEFVDTLRRMGHEVTFVTAGGQLTQKRLRLIDLGFILPEDEVIGFAEKWYLDFDYLVDDRYETMEKWWKRGKSGTLFPRPWNIEYIDRPSELHETWKDRETSKNFWNIVLSRIESLFDEPKKEDNTLKEGETYTNEAGGKQSFILERYDLFDPKAIKAIARVLGQGANKYGVDNWRLIPVEDQINHSIRHFYEYLDGNSDEPHLVNAACRAIFALAKELEDD